MAKRVIPTKAPDIALPVDMKRLGELIRFKRTTSDLTIENAASLCGVSKQTFNNIELGLETVKLKTLFKVLKGLGISLWFENQKNNDEWL